LNDAASPATALSCPPIGAAETGLLLLGECRLLQGKPLHSESRCPAQEVLQIDFGWRSFSGWLGPGVFSQGFAIPFTSRHTDRKQADGLQE